MRQYLWDRDPAFRVYDQHASDQVFNLVSEAALVTRVLQWETELARRDHILKLSHVLCSERHCACHHGVEKDTHAPDV